MAKIIKVCKEAMPAVTFVGKVYHDNDRGENGTFSDKWCEWFKDSLFDKVAACGVPYGDGAYIGAMRMNNGVFEYCIGIFMQSVNAVPAGFDSITMPASEYGVTWIKGKDDPELYSMHDQSMAAFKNEGYSLMGDNAWYIERYSCPHFTQPDENGEVILEYLVSIKS